MDRYVIKGRGENRGKYLCYARLAPELKPTSDGFVWLPEQRKAARWENPKYNRGTWAYERAYVHNGYFVKLVGAKGVDVDVLKSFISEHATGAGEVGSAHWVHGAQRLEHGVDEATNYCFDCCEQKVAEILERHPDAEDDVCVDGGWCTDHDSVPFCETCGAKLECTLTDYGADEEIEALTTYAAPGFRDHGGWQDLDLAIMNLDDDDPRWKKIARVVEAARSAEREQTERETALAVSPGMHETRASLLSLLVARQEQKAPEPSYRLWRTLCRWLQLPYGRRNDPTRLIAAVEKRLAREAKRFADALGYPAYSCGGLYTIDAPYGDYYWPFVVQIE